MNSNNDRVRLCKGNLCIDAGGKAGEFLTLVFTVIVICAAIIGVTNAITTASKLLR
jgi:hypothetical protein